MHTLEEREKGALRCILGTCIRSNEYLTECHANGVLFCFVASLQETCIGLIALISHMAQMLSEEVRDLLIHEYGKPLPNLEECLSWDSSHTSYQYDRKYLFDVLKDELPKLESACCKLLHTEKIDTRNLPKSQSDSLNGEWLIECCPYDYSGDMCWSDVYYDYVHDRFYVLEMTVSGVDGSGDRCIGRYDLPKQTAFALMTDEEKDKLNNEIQRRKQKPNEK